MADILMAAATPAAFSQPLTNLNAGNNTLSSIAANNTKAYNQVYLPAANALTSIANGSNAKQVLSDSTNAANQAAGASNTSAAEYQQSLKAQGLTGNPSDTRQLGLARVLNQVGAANKANQQDVQEQQQAQLQGAATSAQQIGDVENTVGQVAGLQQQQSNQSVVGEAQGEAQKDAGIGKLVGMVTSFL